MVWSPWVVQRIRYRPCPRDRRSHLGVYWPGIRIFLLDRYPAYKIAHLDDYARNLEAIEGVDLVTNEEEGILMASLLLYLYLESLQN